MNAPEAGLPDPFSRYGLVSLWDMIRNYGYELYHLVWVVEKIEEWLSSDEELRRGDNWLSSKDAEEAGKFGILPRKYVMAIKAANEKIDVFRVDRNSLSQELFEILSDYVKALSMHSSSDHLARINRRKISEIKEPDLAELLRELANRIRDDLQRVWFCHVESEFVEYYGQKSAFGDAVNDRFPAAIDDIEEAGNCLALGRNTACVFHLMRAMEASVQALGAALGIANVEKEWGKILSEMATKIGALPKGEKRDEWSACHANLYHVKQAWRNSTMHPKQTYTNEQAREVLRAVRAFMQQLATLV